MLIATVYCKIFMNKKFQTAKKESFYKLMNSMKLSTCFDFKNEPRNLWCSFCFLLGNTSEIE